MMNKVEFIYIRGILIWTSWRQHLKIWAYGLKFLSVFTPKRPLLKTLRLSAEIDINTQSSENSLLQLYETASRLDSRPISDSGDTAATTAPIAFTILLVTITAIIIIVVV